MGQILLHEALWAENFLWLESERCSRSGSQRDSKCVKNAMCNCWFWNIAGSMKRQERSVWVLRGSPQLTAYRKMEPCSTTSRNYILPTIWLHLRASFFLEPPERNTALLTHLEFNLERPGTQKFCWATPCLNSLTHRNWDNKWRLFQATKCVWLFFYSCNRKIMYLYSLNLWK